MQNFLVYYYYGLTFTHLLYSVLPFSKHVVYTSVFYFRCELACFMQWFVQVVDISSEQTIWRPAIRDYMIPGRAYAWNVGHTIQPDYYYNQISWWWILTDVERLSNHRKKQFGIYEKGGVKKRLGKPRGGPIWVWFFMIRCLINAVRLLRLASYCNQDGICRRL